MKQMLGAGLSSFDEEYDGEVAWQGAMVCAHWRCGPTSLPCLRLMTKMTLFSGTYSYSCSEGVPPWCLYYMYNQRSDLILVNPIITHNHALNLINLSGVQSRVSSLWQDNKSPLCCCPVCSCMWKHFLQSPSHHFSFVQPSFNLLCLPDLLQ